MKKLFALLLIVLSSQAIAATPNFSDMFQGKSACFILWDLNKNKLVTEYNTPRCNERISPDSTFKVPLSLMAFDQHLITQKTIFKWDRQDKGLPAWNQDQTPQTWLSNSVVWVSQELTPKLGLAKIKKYLKEFNYGNQDFTGDPGQNNGLTHAWLSSSLKISAQEQLNFLQRLVTNALPVSKDAMLNTKANMYFSTSATGAELYGKTGSGVNNFTDLLPEGWFIGYVQKNKDTYLIVLNFTDLKRPENPEEAGGTQAKAFVTEILQDLQLY